MTTMKIQRLSKLGNTIDVLEEFQNIFSSYNILDFYQWLNTSYTQLENEVDFELKLNEEKEDKNLRTLYLSQQQIVEMNYYVYEMRIKNLENKIENLSNEILTLRKEERR